MRTPHTTNRPSAGEITRAAATFVWTAALVIGAPWALAEYFGWPLPRAVPDWASVASTHLQQLDPHVVLNFFVCLAWVAWATIATYLLLDIVDIARGLGQRTHRLVPFATIAGQLVSSAALLVALARPPTVVPVPTRATVEVGLVGGAAGGERPATLVEFTGITQQLRPASAPRRMMAAPLPQYVVQRGDCLWAIAEAHLGSGFRWGEIYDLNRDRIADPDLIDIGWTLTLPADAAIAQPPSVTHSPPSDRSPSPTTATADAARYSAPPVRSSAAPGAHGGIDRAAPRPPASTQPRPASVGRPHPRRDPPTHEARLPARAPFVLGIAGATTLASALLLAILRFRRRRAVTGQTHSGNERLERAILAAADVPLVRWVSCELDLLIRQLGRLRVEIAPVAVEFSADTGLEILWDRPARMTPPARWRSTPGGWSWQLDYDSDQPVPDIDRPAPIPGLVTFGQRDGRQLLVDLEALGSLSVTGDPGRAEDFLRSVVVELATGDDLANAYVFVVEGTLELDDGGAPRQMRAVTSDQARDLLAASGSPVSETAEGQHLASTLAARTLSPDAAPVEVTVAVARADYNTHDLVARAPARSSVAALVLGEADCGATVYVDPSGTARLEPHGVSFQAAGLPSPVAHQVATLLGEPVVSGDPSDLDGSLGAGDSPSRHPVLLTRDPAPTDPHDVVVASPPVLRSIDTRDRLVDDDWDLPSPLLLVKVLGKPRIPDGPPLGRRELMVVVYLACADGPVDHRDIQDAVWGGDAISTKSVFNLIGSVRAKLGVVDGKPLLGKPRPPQNTLQLAEGVATDLQCLGLLHERSGHVPDPTASALLARGLELIDGPPFSADGYEWAHFTQLVHESERLIERATVDAVDLALGACDIDQARDAVTRGLRGLPGNEILYRKRMDIEETAGNARGARAALNELVNYLDDLGATPSPETLSGYGHLLASTRRG